MPGNDEEIDFYCESFELRPNWDTLFNDKSGSSGCFSDNSIFDLTNQVGMVDYIDEDLFHGPGGEDLRNWNRHSSSLDAGEKGADTTDAVYRWSDCSPLVRGRPR